MQQLLGDRNQLQHLMCVGCSQWPCPSHRAPSQTPCAPRPLVTYGVHGEANIPQDIMCWTKVMSCWVHPPITPCQPPVSVTLAVREPAACADPQPKHWHVPIGSCQVAHQPHISTTTTVNNSIVAPTHGYHQHVARWSIQDRRRLRMRLSPFCCCACTHHTIIQAYGGA